MESLDNYKITSEKMKGVAILFQAGYLVLRTVRYYEIQLYEIIIIITMTITKTQQCLVTVRNTFKL